MSLRQLLLFTCLATTVVSRARAEVLLPVETLLPAANQQLSEDQRAKFVVLYASYQNAINEYNLTYEKAQAADPMLRQAIELRRITAAQTAIAKQVLEQRHQAIVESNPTLADDYIEWFKLYHGLYNETGMITAMMTGEQTRPFFTWSNHFVLTARPRDKHPENLRPFLPESTATLTPDQALKAIQAFVKVPRLEREKKLAELEGKLGSIVLPRKQIEEYSRSNAAGLLYDGYATVNRPNVVKQAEQQVQTVANEINTLWPKWGTVYQEYAKASKPK